MALRVALDVTPLIGRPTGIGVFVRELMDRLFDEAGVEVRGFAMTMRGREEAFRTLPPALRLSRLPMPAGVLLRRWARSSHPRAGWWTGRVDVVHGTNFVVPPSRAATLVTVHDLTSIRFPELCEPATLGYPALVRAAVARGAHVHTLTRAIADEVRELLHVPDERIHVVPAGAPTLVDVRPGRGQRLAGCQRYILALGTVEPRKDYPSLVRAFDIVAANDPDVELVIAGSTAWGAAELHEALGRSAHRNRIRLRGRVTDRQRSSLVRDAAVVAYPSRYEGFGLPPLEAMQVGVPVVASNVPAVAEVVGGAALLVPPGDVEALGSAISKVLQDDGVRSGLVDAGAARVQQFDWAESARRMLAVYREVAAR